MKQIDERVLTLLNDPAGKWILSTCDNEPHVAPYFFKAVAEDGRLLIANVFMENAVNNVAKNGKAAVLVLAAEGMEAYQIKGDAVHLTEGPELELMAEKVNQFSQGRMAARGVLAITPLRVTVMSPGPENNKEL